ncbi:hypothetical protein [Evansella halocellulosilytica]|uniref:hypothetical protein n=1 Tax=Evansella halocellulosilytica TaxID=2011013 RepID=UPI000BB69334|nr:hypothetical protein [Evansella halocellulosilytica]
MNHLLYLSIITAIGLYVISELILWKVPHIRFIKYLPSLLGIISSVIVAIVSFQNILSFVDYIEYLIFSIVLFCLSGIGGVVISMRKSFYKVEGQKRSGSHNS